MSVTWPRFGTLTVQGFRRLRDVKLELRPVSVLIGANGTGKTSLLDALTLLSRSAKGELRKSLSDLGGLASLVTYEGTDELSLAIETIESGVDNSGPWLYWIGLWVQGAGYQIVRGDMMTPDQSHHVLSPDFTLNEV